MRKERRKFPRITLELIVRYKVLKIPEQQIDAQTKNISAGGVCLVAREQMQTGTEVALEIKFPGSNKPIVATGRVAWSRESTLGLSPAGHQRFDNGVEFMEISDDDRDRIIERVKSKRQKTKDKGWNVGIVTDITK
ncbi:MAG: PilZ domain-containing protein [Omnitrophica bacterium]|nr:PilZ domain-containing protein [Candidatus Omnitrophota bacterium]